MVAVATVVLLLLPIPCIVFCALAGGWVLTAPAAAVATVAARLLVRTLATWHIILDLKRNGGDDSGGDGGGG